MKRFGRKSGIAAACVGAALLGGLVTAVPAMAAPSGCAEPSVKFSLVSGSTLWGQSKASCDSAKHGTLTTEIKWDKNILPDPLVAKNGQNDTRKDWDVRVSSCDNGNKRGYYARGYWGGGSHHDTSPSDVRAC
jgi:hypothetical protein